MLKFQERQYICQPLIFDGFDNDGIKFEVNPLHASVFKSMEEAFECGTKQNGVVIYNTGIESFQIYCGYVIYETYDMKYRKLFALPHDRILLRTRFCNVSLLQILQECYEKGGKWEVDKYAKKLYKQQRKTL